MNVVRSILIILIATLFEASGDALIRMGIYKHAGLIRAGFLLTGAAFVFVYGFTLNLAPLQFGQVVGLYIAILFSVWQAVNFTGLCT